MGSGDYQLELLGGPLGGGTARVSDTEVRLYVVRDGGRLRMHPTDDHGTVEGSGRVIGCYGFSHRDESLVWFPSVD